MKSPYYTVYERNPADKDGKITLTAKGDLSNWVYLQVIAQIQQDTILEYVAYKGVKILRPPPKEDDNGKEDNETIKTIIIIILKIVVVPLYLLL